MKDFDQNKTKGLFKSFLHQLMLVDLIRYFVAKARFIYLVKFKSKLRTYDAKSKEISSNTINHNLKGLKDLAVTRSLFLIRPLSVIENLNSDSEILTIGPRTEGEILNLIAYGFKPDKIKGLDLISYSPWIQLGDMHNLPFTENKFDAVILGWVIAYSEDRHKAASEVIRVCRNGGIIAVGVEYDQRSNEEIINQIGYKPGSLNRIKNVDTILSYFGDSVEYIYFKHDVVPHRGNKKTSLVAVFSIKK